MSLKIDSLDHLVLTVRDPGATCDFYARVMGCAVVRFGEGRTALNFGRQKINLHEAGRELALRAERPTPGSGDMCFLTVTPMDEVLRHLDACGVAVIERPVTRAGATGEILSVYFRDPDRNLIEVSNVVA